MSSPKLNLVICHRIFQPKPSEASDVKKFFESAEKFKNKLNKLRDKIFYYIQKIIGGKWEEKDINLYIVPEDSIIRHSISFPLILKLKKNLKLNIYFFIHELIHRYFLYRPQSKFVEAYFGHLPREFREALIIFLTMNVYAKIFGDKDARKMRRLERDIVLSRNDWICEKMLKVLSKVYDIKKPLLKQKKNIGIFLEKYVKKMK